MSMWDGCAIQESSIHLELFRDKSRLWFMRGVVCEGSRGPCKEQTGLEWEDSRTSYHWNGLGKDPNRHILLCRSCAVEHHADWDDMWACVNG